MKNLILLAITLMTYSVMAQNKEALKKIEAAKIALITERLDLTPEQAEKFWPVYNEYNNQLKGFRSEYQTAKANFNSETASEEEYKKLLDLGHQLKTRQLELDKTYSDRLLKVISNRQILNLRRAENDFKKMLLERMRQRNNQRDRQNRNRELQQQRNQRKNNN